MATGRLYLGTSSWTAKGWLGTIYPSGTRQADFISHYAERFDTVEIDATFYAIPKTSVVDGWVERTPESFTLAAQAPTMHARLAHRSADRLDMTPEASFPHSRPRRWARWRPRR